MFLYIFLFFCAHLTGSSQQTPDIPLSPTSSLSSLASQNSIQLSLQATITHITAQATESAHIQRAIEESQTTLSRTTTVSTLIDDFSSQNEFEGQTTTETYAS